MEATIGWQYFVATGGLVLVSIQMIVYNEVII